MKLVDNKVEEYIQEPGIEGVYNAIASAARICYQTDKEKMKLSPKEFVEQVLLKNGHTRPLEFGTVYLKIPSMAYEEPRPIDSRQVGKYEKYGGNPLWTHRNGLNQDGNWYITTNMRVIMQGNYTTDKEAWEHGYDKNWLSDVYDYWCEPTEYHDKRRTFTMWMSRGCTDDYRTHITLSSICESTRFCNYSKGKFGNELTFIRPYWIREAAAEAYNHINEDNCIWDSYFINDDLDKEEAELRDKENNFLGHMLDEEEIYLEAAGDNMEAQQLKRLFPLGVKAELRLCGFDEAWQNFFWRRCDVHADPECIMVAHQIKSLYYNS